MPATLTPQEREALLERFDDVGANGPLNALTRRAFIEIAAIQSDTAPVLSVYVDLSPQNRHSEAWAIGFKSEARDALGALTDPPARDIARTELQRAERWLSEHAARMGRGVALFSSPEHGLWRHFSLPVGLPTRVRLGKRPYLRPLARVRDEHDRCAVVLLDKQRARLFVSQYGFLEEAADIFEDVPGHHKQGGWSQMRFQRHHEAHVMFHAGAVAHATHLLLDRLEIRHLFVSGTPQILSEYRAHLPATAARRWDGEFSVPVDAPLGQITEAVLPLLRAVEAREETAAIGHVNDGISADRGVWGLRATLAALAAKRLRILVVYDRYRAPGRECGECGGLFTEKEAFCPRCWKALSPVEDVVDAALENAVGQEAELELVRSDEGRALLPSPEAIGAVLRF